MYMHASNDILKENVPVPAGNTMSLGHLISVKEEGILAGLHT
jgi:hypothetical protein